VKREQQRNKRALNACLAELRESVASDMLPAFNPVCHLVKGNHRDEIVRLTVSVEADLVVVGDLEHSGLTGLIVESTAEAVSKRLHCSVLIVKPPGGASRRWLWRRCTPFARSPIPDLDCAFA
jgi:nucleotide-binding universal stress UspA family protein